MKKSELAAHYRAKHPGIPTSTLAKTIHSENPGVWSSYSGAESALRRAATAVGDQQVDEEFREDIAYTKKLLEDHPDPDDDQIRHFLAGNLCRCAAYPEIMDAVKLAARKLAG